LVDFCLKRWQQNEEGMELAYYGLSMTPTHMAKLGQLFLQGGWSSATRSLVSEKWVIGSTSPQGGNTDYGYLWWVCNDKSPSMFCALGLGGQDVCVCPSTDRLIVQQRDFNFARPKDDAGSAMGLAALALTPDLIFASAAEGQRLIS
jgi:CubicO group peptidase (beta-lactamase class C family)